MFNMSVMYSIINFKINGSNKYKINVFYQQQTFNVVSNGFKRYQDKNSRSTYYYSTHFLIYNKLVKPYHYFFLEKWFEEATTIGPIVFALSNVCKRNDKYFKISPNIINLDDSEDRLYSTLFGT